MFTEFDSFKYLKRSAALGNSGMPAQVELQRPAISSLWALPQADKYVLEKGLSFDLFTFVLTDWLHVPPKDRTLRRESVRMWTHLHK